MKQSTWEEELRQMCDKNIARDGGAVGTKYIFEIEDFIKKLLSQEREEIKELVKNTKGLAVVDRNGEKVIFISKEAIMATLNSRE